MKAEEKIMEKIKSIHSSTWVLFALSIVVYFPFLVQQLNNADDNTNGYLYHVSGYGWENAQGRFFIRLFDLWRNKVVSPSLIIVLCLIFLMISVELILRIFDINGVIPGILTGALIVFSPSIANLFTYYYTADSYCFSFMLCALSAYLIICRKGIIPKITAGFLLVISMGIYQVFPGIVIMLSLIFVLRQSLICDSKEERKESILTFAYSCITYIASTIVYLLIFKFLELIGRLTPSADRGANGIFTKFISGFIAKLLSSYGDFFRYFFTDDIIYNAWFGRRFLNILIFIMIIVSVVYLIIKNRIYNNALRLLIIVCCLICIPGSAFIMPILVPSASVYAETGLLLISYINGIYIIPTVLLNDWNDSELYNDKTASRIRSVYSILAAFMIIILVVFIQVFARYVDRQQVQITNLANRLVYRMESLERYEEGQQVLVVGRPHRGNYSLPDDTCETITKGMISHYSQIFGGEEQIARGWINAFRYFVGVHYTECPPDIRKELISSDEVQNMGIYPAEDSVRIIDDTVVIKLSEWTPQ